MRRSEETVRLRWFGIEAKEAQVEMVSTYRKSTEDLVIDKEDNEAS